MEKGRCIISKVEKEERALRPPVLRPAVEEGEVLLLASGPGLRSVIRPRIWRSQTALVPCHAGAAGTGPSIPGSGHWWSGTSDDDEDH